MCIDDKACLTRVVGDDCDVQVTRLQDVMQRIERALQHIAPNHRHYIANALLNLAVSRITQEEGHVQTTSVLMRLGDCVSTGSTAHTAERAVELSGFSS